MKTEIFINSSDRADCVRTVESFPQAWKPFTWIVVPHEQAQAYKASVQWNVLVLPKNVPPYLSSQRQYVMDHAGCDKVWLMDDDLRFYRRTGSSGKLRPCVDADMKHMLPFVMDNMETAPFAEIGISTRGTNFYAPSNVQFQGPTGIMRCYCIDRVAFASTGETFAPFEPFLSQDMHVNLSLLENGHMTCVCYEYSTTDIGKSQSKGGCSRYRTPELMEKIAKWMEKRHPAVKAEQKHVKGGWDGFPLDAEGKRVHWGFRVQWSKSFRMKHGISSFCNGGGK